MTEPPPLEISLEFTPNPNTLKYVLNRRILLSGAEYYASTEEAEEYSPLATRLFHLDLLTAVMIGPDFITVTLLTQDNLREANRELLGAIREHIESGGVICVPRPEEDFAAEDDPVSARIREILNEEIRPAVALDGGDITFYRFEDGIVYLHLLGACAGCPSSTMTLQMGILTRLQRELPEVKEILPVG
jgi:Fe-S cluster biogenesis protein NfuA